MCNRLLALFDLLKQYNAVAPYHLDPPVRRKS
jgi:hypothetical protein